MFCQSVSRALTGPICAGLAADRHHIRCPRLVNRVRLRNNVVPRRGNLGHVVLVRASVAYEIPTNEGMNEEAEDFYAILGVVSQCMQPDDCFCDVQAVISKLLHMFVYFNFDAMSACGIELLYQNQVSARC